MAVGEREGLVKVTEWQKTYYAGDSGIQSGATTVRSDDDGTEYSTKKYTYTTTVTENPAGKQHTCTLCDMLVYTTDTQPKPSLLVLVCCLLHTE